MMEQLLRDAQLRDDLAALRPDGHGQRAASDDAVARAVWSVLIEPGDGVAGALIAHLGTVEALRVALDEDDGLRAPGEGAGIRELREARARWLPRAQPDAIRAAVREAVDAGARLVLPGDEEWPVALDDLHEHAPVLLWVRGDVSALSLPRSVALVGARAATGYGERVAADLAGDLAQSGVLIVSGGAYGIDGAAHRAALGVGGRTLAFFAGGVDRAYPAGHQQLFHDMIGSGGAVVSEVPCGTSPTRWRFLARNRLIAALAQATVVVEAGWRSGTLNTAGHAASLGRPLGAVPGPVTSAASAGCHRLLREYDARCITGTSDVRELIGGPDAASAPADGRPSHDMTRLIDALSIRTARPVADIGRRSGLDESRVRSLLGRLALEGRAADEGGAWRAVGSG